MVFLVEVTFRTEEALGVGELVERIGEGDANALGDDDGEGLIISEALIDGVAEGDSDGDADGEADGEADEEADGEEDDDVGEAEGVGGVTTDTPLFQTNFFPDLMQVYFFPLKT